MGPTGPHLPALDRSGPRRTSTSESRIAGPRVGALWASRRDSAGSGPRRTSTGEILGAVGLAGPQPDLNGQKQSHIECQIDMPDEMSEDMPDRMSEDLPDRMSEDMTDRMSEDMPDKMSEDMPDGMPDRYAR